MKPNKDNKSKSKTTSDSKKVNIIQFLNIADNSLHPQCVVSIDEPIFQPEPYTILFEDYEPLQSLTKILKLRNRDNVPRRVSIKHPENRLFQVMPYLGGKANNSVFEKENEGESANTKVAPGMEVSYIISFTPEAKVDITYDLVVITEREKFTVPIRGIGCKVKIEFTESIDFGEVPVKYKIEKPFILRNVGEKITKWMLKCVSSSITISKKEGILDIGKNEQIICTFCPEKEKNYKESMILSYDETDYLISIFGKSKNDAVDIFPKILEMEPAYITLHTEKTVTITNDTGVPIEFIWKQFESKEKEEEAKRRVFESLTKQEAEEKIINELQHTYEENPYEEDTSIDLEDSYDEDEILRMNERNHLKNQNIIARRFEKIKKSLNEDKMCFEHSNFVIETTEGKVWPNTKSTITVSFSPQEAKDYKDIFAFLDVTGSEKRIKLELRGRGIGPKARVNNPEFNLYDVPITHKVILEPKLLIYNIGVIACEFTIESPGTPCSQQFEFSQTEGKISPRDEKNTGEQVIPIQFIAKRLGEFSEKFNIKIGKSKDIIPIVFKGHVIAPYCRFSKERIDFDKVSMGFDKVETVVLFNESDVNIDYRLRIATDSQDSDNEMETVFILEPKDGRVDKNSKKEISISFKPVKERPYDIVVLLDMINIGFDMLTLPVSGICEVPEVVIEPMELLDFGTVHIREEVTREIFLRNTSNLLSTQFKINKQDETSRQWGELICDQQSGQIAPEQTVKLTVKLKALKLQQIRLKLEIDCKTKGYNAREKDNNYVSTINVIATSKGPDVRVFNENAVVTTKDAKGNSSGSLGSTQVDTVVNFGQVETLKERVETIKLANSSPIDAEYTAFMKTAGSIFYVKNPKEIIKAGETKVVEISCKPDEQQAFLETLYFKVKESDGFEVTLKALGVGTTIVPEFDFVKNKSINFGTIFTCTNIEKKIKFENRGRSEQYISFINKKPKKKPNQDDKKQQNNRKAPEEEPEVFRFQDDCPKGKLPPRKYGSMSLIANSRKPGVLTEKYGIHCYKTSDNNGPETWEVILEAEFIDPFLEFSPSKLFYTYKHDEDQDKETIFKMVTITNTAKLPADFVIISKPPFSISKEKFLIEPKESEQLRVDFNPSENKKKKKIETFEGALRFKHINHEKEEELKMTVQINFPNIKNLPNELLFGCLMNDTFTKKTIKLERDTASDLDVVYEWQLIELENSYESQKTSKAVTRKIPLNEIFSIVPMNGRLRKGELEVEDVSITFTPGPNLRYNAIARCLVEGGPEYDIKLSGEASEIKYKIIVNEDTYDSSKKEFSIKFGEIPFNTASKIEMLIKNEGRVPFDYRITYKTDKLRYLSLTNAIDSVNKDETKKIFIEVIPGVPDKMDDEIIVEIAHFEPHHIKIKAIGYYPGVTLSKPLERKEENFLEQVNQIKESYEARKKMLEDYFPKKAKKPLISTPAVTGDMSTTSVSLDVQYELEVNRKMLCEKVIDKMTKGEINANLTSSSPQTSMFGAKPPPKPNVNSAAYRESQLLSYLKDLIIAEYHISFGNIVANHASTISFNVANNNKGPITLLIDKKDMSAKGYTVTNGTTNDKCIIEEGKSLIVSVTHSTNTACANRDVNNIMKLVMSNNECYEIHLHSYVAIPNLSLSTNLIDMNRVYLGRKKMIKFRIENITKVDCNWSVSSKDEPTRQRDREDKREDQGVFDISPKEGRLQRDKKLTFTATFIPNRRKKYQSRYLFQITDNVKPIELILKGVGEAIDLNIQSEVISIGPILPYYKYGLATVTFKNPNDKEIEIYSSDFDKKFLEEENVIRYNRIFARDQDEKIDMPIRGAGESIWNRFGLFDKKLQEKILLFKEYTDEFVKANNESFENFLSQAIIEKISQTIEPLDEECEVKIPPPIKARDKLNIVLLGPEKSGKSSILKEQRMTHFRGIVSIRDLVQWNKDNGHADSAAKVQEYFEAKKKEFDELKVARDKLLKQAKSNKKIVVPDAPSENMYKFVSKEIFQELLRNRLKEKDCSIGTVFDNFTSDIVESPEVILEYIDEVLANENILLTYFEFPKDKDGLEVCHYIDWTKYIEDPHKVRKRKVEPKKPNQPFRGKKPASEREGSSDRDNNNKEGGDNNDGGKDKGKDKNKDKDKSKKDKNKPKDKSEEAKMLKTSSEGISSATASDKFNKTVQISPALMDKFNELYEAFAIKTAPLNSISNSSPKEWTKEEREAFESLVDSMKKKMEEIKDRRLNPQKEIDLQNAEELLREQQEKEKEEKEKKEKEASGKPKGPKDKEKERKEKEEEERRHKEEERKKEEERLREEERKREEEAKKLLEEQKAEENQDPNALIEGKDKEKEPEKIEELFIPERNIKSILFQNCIPQLMKCYIESVPHPKLPDPESLPIPEDEEVQIIRRPKDRDKKELLANFFLKGIADEYSSLTIEEIIEKIKEEDHKLDEFNKKKELEANDPKNKKKPPAKQGKDKAPVVEETFTPAEILIDRTRWIIPANESVKAVVGFFAKEVCVKSQTFLFEIMTYPPVEYKITINGQSDYPSMNTQVPKPKQGTIYLKQLPKKRYEDDFGYILITKDDKRVIENYKATNCRTLRFTNNGKYDLNVDFAFLSSMNFEGLGFQLPFVFGGSSDQSMASTGQIPAPQKNVKKEPQLIEPPTPFVLSKTSVEIKINATVELDVYAFPNRPVEYKDELVCLIKDNPIPTRVSLICRGAEPRVDLETDTLDFEKLVINQPRTKYLKMKNVNEVNCRWALTGLQALPMVYKIEPQSGVIEKGKESLIAVTFCSDKQDKFPFQFNLEIEDNLGYGVKMAPKVVKLMAEAFKISVELVINNEGKVIDFGNVKVKEHKSFPFILRNLGIYKIRYKFEIMKKFWQELFKFEPNEGEIEPGKDKNMLAIFMRYPRDINISPQVNSSEIKLSIFEGEKGAKNQDINIFVNVASYFSKYIINPPKSINFGSLQYNESATRSIEIRNEGQFDFTYEIFEYLQDEAKMKAIKDEKDQKEIEEQKIKEQELKDALEGIKQPTKKQEKKPVKETKDVKGKGKNVEDDLKIGRYAIKNYKGVIAPGSSAKVDVVFTAEGQQFCSANLAIDIQGRQPDDNPLGIPFDLVAESCIPGIETQDFDNIFEEQTVLPSINPDINRQNVITSGIYGIEEKVFWFGTIIASKNPNGVTERFKLINNNKIPCIVKVNVKPRTNSKSEGFAFTATHKTPLKIYPGESEYVTVTFLPTNVMPYSAMFEAIVEGGTNVDTGALKFELRGEGTLPTILLDQPLEYDTDGTALLKFKKTRINKAVTASIILKNEGIVAATVKFEPLVHDCFSFESPTTATIQPKKYQKFDVKFLPMSEKVEKGVLQYKTMFNPYENPKLNLIGEGFFEPVSLDCLQNDTELFFGDVCIGALKTLTFTIINHSDNNYRFNIINPIEPTLEFTPSFGFILAKSSKEITVNFTSKESMKHILKDLFIELKQFKFGNNIPEEDWDSSMKVLKKITPTEQAAIIKKKAEDQLKRKEECEALINQLTNVKGGKPPAKKEVKKPEKDDKTKDLKPPENEEADIDYEEMVPEPQIAIVDKSEKYMPIKLTAVSDYAKYQCNIKEIKFKPTIMFGTRKFDFQLRNTSMIALNFKFSFTNPNPMNPNVTHVSNNVYTSYDKTLAQDNQGGAFAISPPYGTIAANSDELVTIRFSPLEIDEFNFKRILQCNIKDLDPSSKELQIEISGDAERPICHFEIESGIKREGGATILEFESIGMMIKNTMRFFALNPTNQGYEFEWEQQDEELIPNINKVFKCVTPKGIIYSGKKFEMVFEYTPNSLGSHQAVFNFKILNESIPQKFVLNGVTREPMILFNVGKINFGPLLLSGRQKETIQIINEEILPYKFSFDKESIKGNVAYGDSLFVTPICGSLQPKSSTNIEVTFMPRVEKEFNYNLSLKVKQRQKPLTLNVKGVGYTIIHGVYLDNKPEMRLVSKQDHLIDFGEFFINDKRERSIRLENNGSFNFHYMFKKNGADFLKISPDSGTITKGSKVTITLTLLPLNKINLQNHKMFMNIVSGPTYTFLLNAKARSPQIIFSSINCNFGPCYVMRQPVPNTQIITVKNMDKEALTIETNFDNKNKPYLDVILSTGQVVLPYQSQSDILEIPIVFIPREYVKYKDIIKFKFNNIYDVDVEVTGEGIPLKVELEDPSIQMLNFNIIKLGQCKKMEFNVVNRGKMVTACELYPETPSTFVKRCLILKTDFQANRTDEATTPIIYALSPKQTLKVEVTFNPNIRIPQFTEDIMIKINHSERKRLLSVSGASYGVDVKMVGEMPTFGVVTVKSNAIRQITLRNFGDIPASFSWSNVDKNKKDYTEYFSISPAKGTIPPHEDCIVELIFHPQKVNSSISFEKIKCTIEDFDTPIFISLYGRSIECPSDAIFEKKIETQVRVPLTYDIKIKNPTDKLWRITPSFSSTVEQYANYFKGSDQVFEIKPGVEGVYVLTYLPLTMSKSDPTSTTEKPKEHDATVFFPLPDGTAKIFKVLGMALPPSSQKTIAVSAVTREWTPIKLELSNWLYQTQRFKVNWGKGEQGIFIKGANTIDVASNSTKEYKLSFRSLKETPYSFQITFENVDNKEYMFFNVNVTMTAAHAFPTTELIGSIREICTGTITIHNPLSTDVVIHENQIICDNEYLSINPNSIKIPAESELPLDVSFRPLIVGKLNASVQIKSPELGDLKFPILIEGTAVQPKTLHPIEANLGSDKIIQLYFTHYLKKPSVYTVKVEKYVDNIPFNDFIPEVATITADPAKGIENTFNLKFEPSNMMDTKALLKVSSPEGGEYSWILSGKTRNPQAQGPFKVPPGKTYTLEFKNPLNEAVEIGVKFTNLNFTVAGGKVTNRLEAKKVLNLPIGFKAGSDPNPSGTVIITVNKLPPWVYYLSAE